MPSPPSRTPRRFRLLPPVLLAGAVALAIAPGGFRPLSARAAVPPTAPPAWTAPESPPLRLEGNLRILTLEGSPYERGLTHGKALGADIRELVERWKTNLAEAYKTDAESFIKAFLAKTDFRPAIERWTPGLLDEVRGVADGAGLDFDTIYAYQLIDESWVLGPELANVGCTSIGAAPAPGIPGFVSQTLDIPTFYHGFQTVLRIRDRESGHEALVLTIPGVIAANGLNSRGLGVCVNAVTQLAHSADGLPVDFIVRGLLDRGSVEEAERFLREIRPAAPQNYLIGDRTRVVDLEVSAGRVAAVPVSAETGLVFHTNHPLESDDYDAGFLRDLKARGGTLEAMKGSCPRFNFLRRTFAAARTAPTMDDLQRLFRDRRSRINNASTYACAIMVLGDRPELVIAPGRPDREPFQSLDFRPRPAAPAIGGTRSAD